MSKLEKFFRKLAGNEQSSKLLAISFCVGNYIAFSPFPGLHTVMIFLLSWIFRLNTAVVFAVSHIINNPWTLFPIYGIDYLFGRWLVYTFFGYTPAQITTWWATYIDTFCEQTLGIARPCLWSFLVGGNILGILLSILIYPFVKKFFSHYLKTDSGLAHESTCTK